MAFLSTILDIVFPVRCLSCNTAREDLCLACISDLPVAERETPKWIFSLYDYRNPIVKKALRLYKYKHKKRLASVFAEALYPKIVEELSELGTMENFRNPILVPIPISSRRRRERGYNQTEMICREILRLDDNNYLRVSTRALHRISDQKHQARIENRRERLRNIVGSFVVKDEAEIKNQNIILIDDITTTGATLSEARKILKESGAKKIIAFTVAH